MQKKFFGTSFALELILIITIALFNCEEIDASTVQTTDVTWSIAQYESAHTSDPNFSFKSENAIDTCKIDQTLVIFDNPVRLKAFTGEQPCSILLSTKHIGLSVVILHSGLKSVYSYFVTEILGNETLPYSGQYLVDPTPCVTIIQGSHFRFYFQKTEILFEVSAEDLDMLDKVSNTNTSCNVSRYLKQLGEIEDHVSYPPWISFNVTRYFVNSEYKCPTRTCGCILGYKAFYYSNYNNDTINTMEVDWIYYRHEILGISFAKTGICNITPLAFDGLKSVRYLVLCYNNIETLPVHVFEHMTDLEVLDLSYNSLFNLTHATFHTLNELRYFDLSYNRILRLGVVVFDMFAIQMGSYLFDMSHNNMILLDGVFKSLTQISGTINLCHNNLTQLPESAFTSLEIIQGNLDMSYNDIKSLPDGIFSSLEQVWSRSDEMASIVLKQYYEICS